MTSKKLKNPFELLHPRFERAARKASRDLARSKIKHVLIGGIAAGVYGRPRATKDIDFLVDEKGREKLVGRRLGGVVEGITTKYENVPVDLLFSPKIPEVFASIKGIPVISPEELVLLKLKRSLHRDLNDIMEIIRGGNLLVDKLRQLGRQYSVEKEDLDQVIEEALL
jgi:hypothetical protein